MPRLKLWINWLWRQFIRRHKSDKQDFSRCDETKRKYAHTLRRSTVCSLAQISTLVEGKGESQHQESFCRSWPRGPWYQKYEALNETWKRDTALHYTQAVWSCQKTTAAENATNTSMQRAVLPFVDLVRSKVAPVSPKKRRLLKNCSESPVVT